MAKVIQGLESMLSGKFGDKVYVVRDGKNYIRAVPTRKKDSSTPAMVISQKRFREVMRFCGMFKHSVIPQIWNLAAQGTSGFRLFQKTNSPAFAPDGSLPDVKKIRLSTGKLTLPLGLTAGRPEVDSSFIEVNWPKDKHLGGLHLKDELIAISSANGKYSDIVETGILRGQLSGSFELPKLPAPATHIYLFFGSRDHQNYSESICFEV